MSKIINETENFRPYPYSSECLFEVENGTNEINEIMVREIPLSARNQKYGEFVEGVIRENHVRSGGFLQDQGILSHYAERFLVAFINDKPVGFCTTGSQKVVNPDKTPLGTSIHILQLGVKKEYTRNGVGSCLLKYLENHSKDNICINAEINCNNRASLATFKNAGYTTTQGKRNPDTIKAVKDVRGKTRLPFGRRARKVDPHTL